MNQTILILKLWFNLVAKFNNALEGKFPVNNIHKM